MLLSRRGFGAVGVCVVVLGVRWGFGAPCVCVGGFVSVFGVRLSCLVCFPRGRGLSGVAAVCLLGFGLVGRRPW